MQPEYLSTREFERWAEQFDRKLDEIGKIREDVAEAKIEIALLKQQHTRAKAASGTISAVVSGIVSAAIMAYSGGK